MEKGSPENQCGFDTVSKLLAGGSCDIVKRKIKIGWDFFYRRSFAGFRDGVTGNSFCE